MSTKVVGENIKKNGSIVDKNMGFAYDKICKANAQCYYLSWVNAISSANKNVISVLSLAKNVIGKEQEYNKKYINIIKKWDSLSDKIVSTSDVSKLKKYFNQAKKLIGKKAAIDLYKKLGYNVKISGKVVSIVKITKKKNPKSDGSSTSKTGAKVATGNVNSNLAAIAKLKQRLKIQA